MERGAPEGKARHNDGAQREAWGRWGGGGGGVGGGGGQARSQRNLTSRLDDELQLAVWIRFVVHDERACTQARGAMQTGLPSSQQHAGLALWLPLLRWQEPGALGRGSLSP